MNIKQANGRLTHVYLSHKIFTATCKGVTQNVWALSGQDALDHMGWTADEVDSLFVEDGVDSGRII